MLPVKAIAMAVQSEKLIFTVLSAAGLRDVGKILEELRVLGNIEDPYVRSGV